MVGLRRSSKLSVSLWALLSVALSAFALNASAIGLGAASLTSGLGEPLRLSFGVALAADEDVGCIQVRPRGDDLPSTFNIRSSVIRSGSQTRIEIRSLEPINEPAIGLIVSVGCASPVARDYILFLDPPIIPATAPDVSDTAQTPRSVVEPRVPRGLVTRPSTRRPASAPRRPAVASNATNGTSATAPTPTKVPRTNRRRSTPATAPAVNAAQVPPAAPARTTAPLPAAPIPRAGDRLSVVPTEPPATGATSSAASGAGTSSVPSTATSSPSTTAASAAPSAVAPAPVALSDADAAAAREQALKQQQTDLQVQLKALGDQIAALRVQTATLAARNQALEESAYSPTLIWLLIALAAIAIIVAGWMAWRYTQLRRSLEGSAWWTNNTVQAPTSGMTVAPVDTRGDLGDLNAGTRMASRPATQTDVRSNVAVPSQAVNTTSNLERSRPTSRSANYPPAIDTDFTVSDIEAAMATVRTVSPPRPAARAPDLDDSDFAPLGGPTIPSPFSDPPPAAARSVKPVEDDLGKFVDLDIPPMTAPLTSRAPTTSESLRESMGLSRKPSPPPAEAPPTEAPPIDFKLDITNPFDPLSTDSHKTTVVDRPEPVRSVDFELPGSQSAPTELDFELPSATQIMTIHGPSHSMEPTEVIQPRHGATALDDLFTSNAGLGPDTILDLDERHGSPLSTTEVDRLTSTEVNGPDGTTENSTRSRMARFADLMNQVDEGAVTDPLRAIALLRQYVLRDERIPTLLWLRLFELYKAVDKKPVYEALAEHFNRRYHRPMVTWSQTLADRVPQTPLSAFHELDREIEASWGTEKGLDRLQTLLCDRTQDDAIVFNAVLQRDLLDAAKIYPVGQDTPDG